MPYRAYPGRFAILGAFPLDDPASHGLVDGWLAQPGMLGLRFTFLSPHQRNWMTDGTADWVWPAAERAGIPIALLATDHLVKLGEIAERHPGLKLIVDHLGGRGGNELKKDDAALEHMPQLLALAKHPNVAVKATGAPGYSSEGYPFRPIQPYLHQIYDAFGPDRHVLGHGHLADALHVAGVHHPLHRGAALAPRRGQAEGDGPVALQLDRLAALADELAVEGYQGLQPAERLATLNCHPDEGRISPAVRQHSRQRVRSFVPQDDRRRLRCFGQRGDDLPDPRPTTHDPRPTTHDPRPRATPCRARTSGAARCRS